jgi:hypothetical protein
MGTPIGNPAYIDTPAPGTGTGATVGQLDGRQPTLLPNFDVPVVLDADTTDQTIVGLYSPAHYLSYFPRALSSVTLTVSGTITNNDTLSVTLTNGILLTPSPVGTRTVTVTAVTGDTITTVATKIAKALNDDVTLQPYGVFADTGPGGAGGLSNVVTLNWPGPLGNFTTVTTSKSPTGATETLTLSASALSGGSGPVIPFQNFWFSQGGQTSDFWIGQPVQLDYYTLSLFVAQGMPVA